MPGCSRKFGVHSSRHCRIVGRGGSTIKELQSKHDVNIEVSSRENPHNTVLIEGESENVDACKAELEEILQLEIPEGALHIMELDVPSYKFGAVIGSGGDTLKDIEEQCRVNVTVPHRDAPEDTRMSLEGSQEACEAAVKQVADVTGLEVAVVKHTHAGLEVACGEGPAVDLQEEVHRALFFPDHVEEDGQRTLHVFLQYLNSVTTSLDVCVFTITNNDISATILNAHRRGAAVRVICDDDQSTSLGADIQKLRQAGIPVRTDRTKAHMHHKFAVLDGKVLLNGSFNWTLQAQTSNRENVMITSDEFFVEEFKKHYEQLWEEFAE